MKKKKGSPSSTRTTKKRCCWPPLTKRTQLEDSYEYPAVLVSTPSDSYTTLSSCTQKLPKTGVRTGKGVSTLLTWLQYSDLTNEKRGLGPMTMGTRCCKVFFHNYSKNKSAQDTRVPPLYGGNARKKKHCFLNIICSRGCTRGTCAFMLKIVNTLMLTRQ